MTVILTSGIKKNTTPTDPPVANTSILTRTGNKIYWKTKRTQLNGVNWQYMQAFDAAGVGYTNTAIQDFIVTIPAKFKETFGLNCIRMNVLPKEYQDADTAGVFWNFTDRVIEACRQANLFVVLCLQAVATPGVDSGNVYYNISVADWEDFVEKVAIRYGKEAYGFLTLLLWDEFPDQTASPTGSTNQWRHVQPLLQSAYDVFRAAQTDDVLVLFPGGHYARDLTLYDTYPITGSSTNFAFVYNEFESLEPQQFRAYMTAAGGAMDSRFPILIAGTGYEPVSKVAPTRAEYITFINAEVLNNQYDGVCGILIWDGSAWNTPNMLLTGYPTSAAFSLSNFGKWGPTTFEAPMYYVDGTLKDDPNPDPDPDPDPTLWDYTNAANAWAIWNPRDSSSLTLATAAVTQINDLTTNNRNLVQATAGNRFTYNATGLAGGPGLITDGGDTLTGAHSYNGTTFTFMCLARFNTTLGGAYGALATAKATADANENSSSASVQFLYRDNTDATFKSQRGPASLLTLSNQIISGNAFIFSVRYTGSLAAIRFNGVDIVTTTMTDALNFTRFNLGSGGPIGGFYNIGGFSFGPIVCLTTANFVDIEKFEGKVASDYSLQSLLPADHPYKVNAPTLADTGSGGGGSTGGGGGGGGGTPSPSSPIDVTKLFLNTRTRTTYGTMPTGFQIPAFTKQIHVASNGNNNNSGATRSVPKQTIAAGIAAAVALGPGTEVLIAPGTYRAAFQIGESARGNSNGYYALRAYPNEPRPVISAGPAYDYIKILGAYWLIEGLEFNGTKVGFNMENGQFIATQGDYDTYANATNGTVKGSTSNTAITIDGRQGQTGYLATPPNHIIIRDCVIYDFAQGGVAIIASDYILCEDNLVYNCGRWSRWGASGITNIYDRPLNDGQPNIFHRIIYRRNVITDILQLVNSTFINQNSITDGNCMQFDENGNLTYPYGYLSESNILTYAGGSGVHTLSKPNVTFRNNTIWQNNRNKPARGELSCDTYTTSLNGIGIYNNVIVPRNSVGVTAYSYQNSTLTINHTSQGNIVYNPTNAGRALPGFTALNVNPLFVSATEVRASANFTPQSGSPLLTNGVLNQMPDVDILWKPKPTTPRVGAIYYA
jgi:hypothetical protein